jgi:aerobic carbon-monoxide dehydrogenase large subunit
MTSHAGNGKWRGRLEDNLLVRGLGSFTDDQSSGSVNAVFVRSPHAHALIKAIDVAAARHSAGVLAVFTGSDFAPENFGTVTRSAPLRGRAGEPPAAPHRPILAATRVVHVGEPVAMVIAETLHAAQDAAESVVVDYDVLTPLTEPTAAATGDPIWPEAPANVALDWLAPLIEGRTIEMVDARFRDAAHVATVALNNQRLIAASLEPRAAVADYDAKTGLLTLWCGNQGVARMRDLLADILRMKPGELRVLSIDVGGGFGMKTSPYPEYAAVLYAARALQRPVRWVATRSESFVSDHQARDSFWKAELAVDKDARFTAMRVEATANTGAFPTATGHYCSTQHVLECLPSVYDIEAIHFSTKCNFTNTVPVGPYRGAGRPEGNYLMERLVDAAAAATGLDPVEIRRRNFIRPQQIPYVTPFGMSYDTGDFPAVFEDALRAANYEGFPARRKAAKKRGKLLGFGIGFYMEVCGGILKELTRVNFNGAKVHLSIGAGPNGQGHVTVFSRLLAELLGIDQSAVVVDVGDSSRDVFSFGSVASRTGMMVGGAIAKTVDALLAKAKPVAALLLQCSEADVHYAAGNFTVAGTHRHVSLFEVAHQSADLVRQGIIKESLDTQAEVQTSPSFPNGCHIAEVEIDPLTGELEITSYIGVDDCGTVLDPVIVEGQLHGGIAQGVGQALFEEALYDDNGQLITGSFLDYAMPRATSMLNMQIFHRNIPCSTNPLGVKGVGESGTTAAPPAVVNAIANALPPAAAALIQMPVTSEKIWQALRQAERLQ